MTRSSGCRLRSPSSSRSSSAPVIARARSWRAISAVSSATRSSVTAPTLPQISSAPMSGVESRAASSMSSAGAPAVVPASAHIELVVRW